MNAIVVDLVITPEEFQRLYQGSADTVHAYSLDGRKIQFPANILRPFVTHYGIRGRFQILFDEHRRFQGIERLG